MIELKRYAVIYPDKPIEMDGEPVIWLENIRYDAGGIPIAATVQGDPEFERRLNEAGFYESTRNDEFWNEPVTVTLTRNQWKRVAAYVYDTDNPGYDVDELAGIIERASEAV